jgi:hypothetical protein
MLSKKEERIDEDEKSRILNQIVQESSGDDSSDEQESSHSMISEEDLLNHSLESDGEPVIDEENFLKYVTTRPSVLETIDKNERSFKQVAE